MTVSEEHRLMAIAAVAGVAQNAIAIPYVHEHGPRSVGDFFVGKIWSTVPGKFAMVDLMLVVVAFHAWALPESGRLGIRLWWWATLVMTFTVGIATASFIPSTRNCWTRPGPSRAPRPDVPLIESGETAPGRPAFGNVCLDVPAGSPPASAWSLSRRRSRPRLIELAG